MLKMMLLVSLVMMRCLPLMCRQAHIIAEGNIISEATSFARQGKHHSKKAFVDKTKAFFVGADYETRTRHLHLGKVALYRMS